MTTNDPRGDAILALASAIHHINMNPKSRALAEHAEGIVRGVRIVEDLSAWRDALAALAASVDSLQRMPEQAAPTDFDPFAPVFQLDGDGADGKLGVTITLKPGTVVYLINATGPRSNAITYSAAGPKHVLVRPVVEIEPGS